MSIVYVVQDQQRFDHERGELVPRFDLSSAEKYGELEFLLSPSAAPWASASISQELDMVLQHYDDEDYLLLVGNPVLIGMAVATAAGYNDGRVRMLQWSGRDERYLSIVAIIPVLAQAPA